MSIKKIIRQLFCKHDYELGRRLYSYIDTTGVKVVVYACHCKKCEKITHEKLMYDIEYI